MKYFIGQKVIGQHFYSKDFKIWNGCIGRIIEIEHVYLKKCDNTKGAILIEFNKKSSKGHHGRRQVKGKDECCWYFNLENSNNSEENTVYYLNFMLISTMLKSLKI